MRVRNCVALIALVLLIAAPRAQQQTPQIRLDIHATSDGRPVTDLTAADLAVLEDGVPQTIESFTHATAPGYFLATLRVAVLLFLSGHSHGPLQPALVGNAKLLDALVILDHDLSNFLALILVLAARC